MIKITVSITLSKLLHGLRSESNKMQMSKNMRTRERNVM